MPEAWIVRSWKVEPFLCSPRYANEDRSVEDKLMNHANEHPGLALRIFDTDPALVYSIDAVERLAQRPTVSKTVYNRVRFGTAGVLAIKLE